MRFSSIGKISILSISCLLMAGCTATQNGSPHPTTSVLPQSSAGRRMQLETFNLSSPLATPGPTQNITPPPATPGPSLCPEDTGQPQPGTCQCEEVGFTCTGGHASDITVDRMLMLQGHKPTDPDYEQAKAALIQQVQQTLQFGALFGWQCAADGKYCVEKPVVYLYPPVPTFVSVFVKTTGQVVISNPVYGRNGWQHVLALPNGQIQVQGQYYHELFYETDSTLERKPTSGVVLPRQALIGLLPIFAHELGLAPAEAQEFSAYWAFRLQSQSAPYFQFSIIDHAAKDRIDQLHIVPTPQTEIAFLAYFKPLQSPIVLPPMQFPHVPVRQGFTAVEWGGILDSQP